MSSKRIVIGLTLGVLLVGGTLAWRERTALHAWFCVRGLAKATEANRSSWVKRVAGLGEAALPSLLACLKHSDDQACSNVREVLSHLVGEWGLENVQTRNLAARVAQDFSRLGANGQRHALVWATRSLVPKKPDAPLAPGMVDACVRLLAEASRGKEASVRALALDLCLVLLAGGHEAETLNAGRELVREGLRDTEPATRLRSVQIAGHLGPDLLDQVAGALGDPSEAVRRAALEVVGPADQMVPDDVLLPCLHDPDLTIRALCEQLLRARGRSPQHVKLARLLTDSRPSSRLEVLDHLFDSADLDPGVWLRRLSHDPSPAVRVAAVRAMAQQNLVHLYDRLDQMARNDPSLTVCQLARYYLNCPKIQ